MDKKSLPEPLTNEAGDVRELTKADFAKMRPATEFFTVEELAGLKRLRGQRGRQKTPLKDRLSLRLDHDIVAYFKAQGTGWQTRINDTLRHVIDQTQR